MIDSRWEALLRRVVADDKNAWHELWMAAEPTLWAITGSWRITSRLSQLGDDRHNIVTDVMGRLRENDFRPIRAFLESIELRGGGSFKKWLATFTVYTAIDYVRSHPEYSVPSRLDAKTAESQRDRWVRIDPMPDFEPAGPAADIPRMIEAMEVVEVAHRILKADQLEALLLWLVGLNHAQIARRLGLHDARTADKVVRASVKRLRDWYAPRGEPLSVNNDAV
jgi:DNA-directed RNA polymerase specialized sigma24 family protein